MLVYTTHPPQVNDDIFYSTNRRNWIEIYPRGKQNFDILSLIDFADSLTENFVCTEFTCYKDVISIKARHFQFTDEKTKSIWISIKDNYSNIHVYLKDSINTFQKLKEEDTYYIVTKMFSDDTDGSNNFSSSSNLSKYFEYRNSILYALGNYVAKSSVKSPLFLKIAFKNFLCPKTQFQSQNTLQTKSDLYSMVQSLPG